MELLTCDACGIRTDEVAVLTISTASIEKDGEELIARKQYCIPCFSRMSEALRMAREGLG